MKNIYSLFLIALCFILSCKSKSSCSLHDVATLRLDKANVTVRLPSFVIRDSLHYIDGRIISYYDLKTTDSVSDINLFVKDFTDQPDESLDIKRISDNEKQQAESGRDSLKLFSSGYETINSFNIGHLYYEDAKNRRFEGRLFFYNEKKLVTIWFFESIRDNSSRKEYRSKIECILRTIMKI